MPLFLHFFLALILHLIFSRTEQTHLFTSNMYSMWQMLQHLRSMVKLKIGKTSFTSSVLLLIVLLPSKHKQMGILKDNYLPNTSKFELFYSSSKHSTIPLMCVKNVCELSWSGMCATSHCISMIGYYFSCWEKMMIPK